MSTHRVTTQAELDAALKDHGWDPLAEIAISSPAGVWLEVSATGSSTVTATGSSTVTAYGSSTVRAYDSSTVRAYGSSTVRASAFVAVHLHSARVTHSGGVLIDVTALELTDPQTWCDYTGASVEDGNVLLYKAVDGEYVAGQAYKPTTYPIGEDVTASDWRDDHGCGGGLHASPHPHQAQEYASDCERMLIVSCPLADLRPIPGDPAKAKARTFTVLREVHIDGSEMT